MSEEARRSLAKAEQRLKAAQANLSLGLPDIAGALAYSAAYHAAQAFIRHRTGRHVKTHAGVRTEFARLVHAEPRPGRELTTFLARGYELKAIADYATDPDLEIAPADAAAAIAAGGRFLAWVTEAIEPD